MQVVLALGRMRCRPSEEWAEWLATELQGRVSVATPPLQVVQMVHAVAACMPDSGPMEDWVLTAAGEVLLHHIQVCACVCVCVRVHTRALLCLLSPSSSHPALEAPG
eukprot:1157456-Pelagomonas_calceolata.AAC.3